MPPENTLKQAIEIIESAVADFEKLTPFIGRAATDTAAIYRDELEKLKQSEDIQTTDALERELYVPGCWICPQCSFQQHNAHMTPDGRISANTKPEMRPCPNDGMDMIPLTWQKLAKESQAVAMRMIKEKDMLLQAAYNLSMFLREYVAPAEAGNQADEWPIKIVVADNPDVANRLACFLQAQEQALAAAGAPVTPKPQGGQPQ